MKVSLIALLNNVEKTYSKDLTTDERTMDLNYLRQAFTNALRPYYTTTELGQILKRNHATIVHYSKGHTELMKDTYYREAYNRVVAFYNEMWHGELPKQPIEALIAELQEIKLRLNEVEHQIYKHRDTELQSNMV